MKFCFLEFPKLSIPDTGEPKSSIDTAFTLTPSLNVEPYLENFLNFMNPFLTNEKNKAYAVRSIKEFLNRFRTNTPFDFEQVKFHPSRDLVDFIKETDLEHFDAEPSYSRLYRSSSPETFLNFLKSRFVYGEFDFIDTPYVLADEKRTLMHPSRMIAYKPSKDTIPGLISLDDEELDYGDIDIVDLKSETFNANTDIVALEDGVSVMLVKMHVLITREVHKPVNLERYCDNFFREFSFECPSKPKQILPYRHFLEVTTRDELFKCLVSNNLQFIRRPCFVRYFEPRHFNGLPFSFLSYNAFIEFGRKLSSGNRWLNGDLINHCLQFWKKRYRSPLGIVNSEVMIDHSWNESILESARETYRSFETVVVPFNSGAHWTLAVISKDILYFYDSLRYRGERAPLSVTRLASEILGSPPKEIFVAPIPKQPGSYECGYSVLYFAHEILKNGEGVVHRKSYSDIKDGMSDLFAAHAFEFIRGKVSEAMIQSLFFKESGAVEVGEKRKRADEIDERLGSKRP